MRRLVVISNRLPVIISKAGDGFHIREGAGGLVTALKPLLLQRGGAWIGFCGMLDEDRGTGWEELLEERDGEKIDYRPVTPAHQAYEGYYNQYSNQELWPRFHEMIGKMSDEAAAFWPDYVSMNQRFAGEAEQVIGEQSLVWIHDYHLMLLPRILRESRPGSAIGHFLHIPFPPAEIMAGQPHARQLFDGLLASDLLGFHIPAYMENFIASAQQILGLEVTSREGSQASVKYEGRNVRLGAFPIGIEPSQVQQQTDTASLRQRLKGIAETVILSMDRLDYTKAIPPRLEAYGQLLDRYPQYQENVSLVQLVDLSRKSIPAYQEERQAVDRIVEKIGARYGSWNSLAFVAERWQRQEVGALMGMSRVCLVTPRCDGMNLVAKEYVAAAPDDGVLVLSHQTGAAWQFGEHAVMVDANSQTSLVEGLRTALQMPEQERRRRMQKLKENVHREDVFWWAEQFLENLQGQQP